MPKRLLTLFMLAAGSILAGEPFLVNIQCEPQQLSGLPGQPLQTEITIQTDRAATAQLSIPRIRGLHLRTVETVPIRRTNEGRYIQKRIVIWQGLEAGSVSLTNLTVRFQGLENKQSGDPQSFQTLEKKCPAIEITINEVTPAQPPKKQEVEE